MAQSGPLKVLFAGMNWRAFGSASAAETLLEAVSGDDEQQRMLAGMSLVRAGGRTIDLIGQALDEGRATADLVRLLADLDDPRARRMLESIAAGEDGNLAQAARESLDLLERIQALDGNPGEDE